MIIPKYCIIVIISIGILAGSVVIGWCADEISPSNLKKIHRTDLSPKTSTPTIPEKELIPMKSTPSIDSNATTEQNAQAKICLDFSHNAKTIIDSMRQNCAANSPSRYTFNSHVQDLKSNILNWKQNHCTDSILSLDQKITYNMISSSEFNKIQNMCTNRCWNTLQGQIKQGSFYAFPSQCRECCGFYPLDIVQRCSSECSRNQEAKKEVEKNMDELMEQLSNGITAIMKMMDTILKTNSPLSD
jgi:hypothetical protein